VNVKQARLSVDPTFRVGEIDPRLWGGLVEHVGRNVYGGIYEPAHPTADAEGFRGDVTAILRELPVPLYRYPGGCFVSGYRWEDGIGPRDERRPTLELAWRTVEPNEVGVDEFVPWSRRAGGDTFMVVNMGTRGAEAARDLVEYCNHPGGSPWSDRRIANGVRAPHRVPVWGLGNEMDSPNELGSKTADEYGRLAYETAKLMRRVDPDIEIVACGTTNARMPTYPRYAATVLEHAYDVVDHVAIHEYYGNPEDDLPTYLARSLEMDDYIESHIAACDYVRARLGRRKRIMLSFDEWNISWYHSHEADRTIPPWTTAPPFMEDIFTFEDALVLGCMGISLLRHADRVKIGAMSTIVNNVGVLMTVDGGAVWRQTTFYPYADLCRYAHGVALDVRVAAPQYETSEHGRCRSSQHRRRTTRRTAT
jgi:alpha-N-arabinofuranosidase